MKKKIVNLSEKKLVSIVQECMRRVLSENDVNDRVEQLRKQSRTYRKGYSDNELSKTWNRGMGLQSFIQVLPEEGVILYNSLLTYNRDLERIKKVFPEYELIKVDKPYYSHSSLKTHRDKAQNMIDESENNLSGVSIIHGTMHPQHVASAICSFLEEHYPDVYKEFAEEHPRMTEALKNENDDYWQSEELSYDLYEDLFDKMNDLAPEGHYFGTHPGDASDLGFWPNDDDSYLDEAIRRAIQKNLR